MNITPPSLHSVPKHVAIIMDGNGRWAKKNNLSRIKGHHEGAQSVRAILRAAKEVGIRFITIYAFSTENWKRSNTEVNGLMDLLVSSIKKYESDLHKNKIRLRIMGQIERLPEVVQNIILKTMEETSNYTESTLILALSYGGRAEITDAVRLIANKVKLGDLNMNDINEDAVKEHLYLSDIPDPEMIIRTSGEMRLSNFMLWQLSYSEIIITDVLWPEFREKEFYDALIEYNKRERRFGRIKNG